MRIWHYTVGMWLRSILEDQMIKLATKGVPTGERPVLWTTTNPNWEPTAKKGREQDGRVVTLGKQETAAYGEGLYRIEVVPEAAPYGWEEFKRLSNIPERMAKSLARVAREQGSNHRDWRVSFEPIAADKWLRIEIEVGHSDQWTELSTDLAKAWTRPTMEKGCPGCSETEQQYGAPWRYMPEPTTREPRVMCASCYSLIKQKVAELAE